MASAEAVADGAAALHVEVVYCPAPGDCDRRALTLPAGSTVQDALQASGLVERHGLDPAALSLGVWCRAAAPTQLLRDADRVELYRPLQVDPKEARRQRYRSQRERGATGTKPGPERGPGR